MTDLRLLPADEGQEAALILSETALTPVAEGDVPPAAPAENAETLPAVYAPLSVPETEVTPGFRVPFAGQEYLNAGALAQALADHWEEARRMLLAGTLAELLDAACLSAAAFCRAQTAAVAAGTITPDRAVLAVIHHLSGSCIVVWQGRRYADAIDLGASLLQALRGSGAIPAHFSSLLTSGAVALFAPETQRMGLASLAERCAAADCTQRELLCLMYLVGYLLCGVPALVMEGETFYTVAELAQWLEARCRRSSAAFTRACHRLLDADGLLDPQLEAWLIALGHHADVAKWQAESDAMF